MLFQNAASCLSLLEIEDVFEKPSIRVYVNVLDSLGGQCYRKIGN
jgi:hypothetical protein